LEQENAKLKRLVENIRATSKEGALAGNRLSAAIRESSAMGDHGKYGRPRSGGRDARHPSLKGTILRRSGASPDSSLPESSSSEALSLSIKPAPKRIFHSSSISRSWLRF